jgi:CRISPR-associated protein (TIGR03986 family)
MSLTPEEQKRRLTALLRAQGLNQAEIDLRLKQTKPEPATDKKAEVKGRKPPARRPEPGRIPFERLSQPYRFITLPDEVLPPENGLVPLDEPLSDGYCATVTVEWIAETPLLIGGAATPKKKGQIAPVEPLTIGGRCVLPGATLRGLVRHAVEIVAHGKMTQGNWHYRFGLRDFEHPYYKDEVAVSKVKELHAGFLRIRDATEDDGQASVIETDGRRKVWELSPAADWGHVTIGSLGNLGVGEDDLRVDQDKDGNPVYRVWAGKALKDKYDALGMIADGRIDFTRQVRFRLVEEKNGRKIYVADSSGTARGVMLVAGKLPGGGNKKFEYFVTRDSNPNAPSFALTRDVVELFERLYSEPSKGDQLRLTGSWKELRPVAERSGIPVFYVGNPDPRARDARFFFGLTRLFKVPHKLSVGQILRETQPAHIPRGAAREQDGRRVLASYENVDFVENLFGYVVEPRDLEFAGDDPIAPDAVARKGRIAFGFAFLNKDTPAKPTPAVEVIQMAPRASFAPFYLRGAIKDYSGGSSRLAGRKAYIPRYQNPANDRAVSDFQEFGRRQVQLVKDASRGRVSPDVLSHLVFLLPEGNRPLMFSGDIRLHNVTAAELGAVLYALTHGGDREKRFRHMIGRGKPFGAGQVRVGKILLRVEANKRGADARIGAPTADEIFRKADGKGLADENGHSLSPFLSAFETYLCKTLHLHAAADAPAIREWLGMADPQEGQSLADKDRLFYHPFAKDDKGHYQSPFAAFRLLRQATQCMDTTDKPQGQERLLAAPDAKSTPR